MRIFDPDRSSSMIAAIQIFEETNYENIALQVILGLHSPKNELITYANHSSPLKLEAKT